MTWLAERQHGVVSLEQLRICGVGERAIAQRRRCRTWRPIHRGVYLIGPQPPTELSRILAAVLRCGHGARASHETAAWLWGLTDRPRDPLHVTTFARRHPGRVDGARVHRPLGESPAKLREGVPVTGPATTLLDLAAEARPGDLDSLVALALAKRLLAPSELRHAVATSAHVKGIRALREVVRAVDEPRLTRSRNERKLVDLATAAELPRFETNVIVNGKEVDLYWPEAKLAVEVDAYSTHGGIAAFEGDRKVDADLKAADTEVLRFTDRRIDRHPHAVVARMAAVLALRLGGLPAKRRR